MTRPLLIVLLLTGCSGKVETKPNCPPLTAASGAGAVEESAQIDAALLDFVSSQPREVTLGIVKRTLQRDGYLRFEYRFSDVHEDSPVLDVMEWHTDLVPLGGCKVDLNNWFSIRSYGTDMKQQGDDQKQEMMVWHLDLAKLSPRLRGITPKMFTPDGYTFGYKVLMTVAGDPLKATQTYSRTPKPNVSYAVYAAQKETQIQLAKALSHAITLCRRNPLDP